MLGATGLSSRHIEVWPPQCCAASGDSLLLSEPPCLVLSQPWSPHLVHSRGSDANPTFATSLPPRGLEPGVGAYMLYREAPPPCHGLPWLPQLPLASWDPLPPAASLWPAWEGMKVGGLKARADAVCDPGQSPSPLSLSLPICTNRTRAVTSPVPHPLAGFGASAYPPVWAQGPGRSWQAGPPAMFSSRHTRGTAGGGLPACPAGPSALPLPPPTSRPLGPYLCLINARWIPWS